MNYCRSCKYWARCDHMIGLGYCNNFEVAVRLANVRDGGYPSTAQDFGCILHEEGPPNTPSMYPYEEQLAIYHDAIGSQKLEPIRSAS